MTIKNSTKQNAHESLHSKFPLSLCQTVVLSANPLAALTAGRPIPESAVFDDESVPEMTSSFGGDSSNEAPVVARRATGVDEVGSTGL